MAATHAAPTQAASALNTLATVDEKPAKKEDPFILWLRDFFSFNGYPPVGVQIKKLGERLERFKVMKDTVAFLEAEEWGQPGSGYRVKATCTYSGRLQATANRPMLINAGVEDYIGKHFTAMQVLLALNYGSTTHNFEQKLFDVRSSRWSQSERDALSDFEDWVDDPKGEHYDTFYNMSEPELKKWITKKQGTSSAFLALIAV